MSASSKLFPSWEKIITELGENVQMARLRRKLTSEQVADRAGVSRPTVYRIEQGEYTVSIGNYLKVLAVLNLENDLLLVGRDETLEQQLQELGMEVKERAPQHSIKR